jgi:hypothetical protein
VGSFGVAAAAGVALAQDQPSSSGPQGSNVLYRTLGRTGLKISAISMGSMTVSEVAVMQAAFDMGVNYVDTARVYMGGRNERIVGDALKGYRDKVFVATKVKYVSKDQMAKAIEESLAALQVDHVDVLQLHDVSKKENVLNKEPRDVLAQARQQGKTRFVGITVHANEAETLDNIVDDPEKFFDVVLVTYNFKSDPKVKEAIARAAKANIGIVAMKTQAGGYKTKELGDISPHQAALKWVVRDPNVTAAVPAMENLQQLKENTAVMGMNLALTQADRDVLDRYGRATAAYYCHRCGICRGTCPNGVNVPTINRSLMYAEGYGNLALARETHASLSKETSCEACRDCATCVARCPRGIDIGERIGRAQALLI